jgi:hypothetical protein
MPTQRTLPLFRSGFIAIFLLGGFASNALADKITITGHTDYRDGVGGEFNVRAHDAGGAALLAAALGSAYFLDGPSDVAGSANGTLMRASSSTPLGFQTFCLEYNEHITLGGTYDAQIGTAAIRGGVGIGSGPTSPRSDPISVGTAYLYTLFATGLLDAHYTYENGDQRAKDAESLQKAFWYLENERTLAEIGGSNLFVTLALNKFGGEVGARADYTGNSVGVLNLTSSAGHHQSQLIYVPDGGVTAILLGLALSGLAALRRKAQ